MIRTEIENYGSKVQPKVDIEKVLATPADIVIAARNSSITARRQAHVIFEGKNDERQLSAIYSELTRNGGRRIHAKAGQYNLSDNVTVRSGIWLTGDSWADDGAFFKMANSANKDMFVNANTGTNTTDDWFGFYNLHLSGNNDNNTSGSCFKFGKIAVVGFDHLAIQDWAEDAIQIIGGTNASNPAFSLYMNALEIADFGDNGIYLKNVANSHFSNINFTGGGTGGGDYAIQLDGTLAVKNLNFTNVYAEMAAVQAAIYLLENTTDCNFANLKLTGTTGDGISINSGTNAPAGNQFTNGVVKMSGATGTAAVYIKGSSNQCKFMNFYAQHVGGVGYQVEGTVNTLIACIAELCDDQGFYFLTAGVKLNKAIGCTADRNGANLSTNRYGFHINNSSHCQIIACSSGNTAGSNQTYGAYEDGASANFNQINQNTFKGNGTGGTSTVGAGTTTADNITQA